MLAKLIITRLSPSQILSLCSSATSAAMMMLNLIRTIGRVGEKSDRLRKETASYILHIRQGGVQILVFQPKHYPMCPRLLEFVDFFC
jgi:hypothetical protein